jgi:hypothetical protein
VGECASAEVAVQVTPSRADLPAKVKARDNNGPGEDTQGANQSKDFKRRGRSQRNGELERQAHEGMPAKQKAMCMEDDLT